MIKKLIEYNERNKANDRGFRAEFHDVAGIMSTLKIGGSGKDDLIQIVGGSQGERIYDPNGISTTLASQSGGMGGKTGLYAFGESRVRRLTPVECERLQGFPDGWTEGVSETQRYKQLGNAVTVNVVEAIFNRLLAQ